MRICLWDGHATDRIHVSHFGGLKPYSFEAHQHFDFYELVYVRRGTLEHVLADVAHAHGPGVVTLIRPGETHGLRGSKVEYLNISFDTSFVTQLDPVLRHALASTTPCSIRLPVGRRGSFEADGEALAAATAPALQSALLIGMLCTVTAAVLQAHVRVPMAGPPWLARLCERVADDDQPVPDLATLRRWAGVSAEHVARTVHAHLGCTPIRWLQQLRIRRGARLLAATDLPVATVAQRCGYSDSSLFHRNFTALHGCGPRAYRQREQRFIVG